MCLQLLEHATAPKKIVSISKELLEEDRIDVAKHDALLRFICERKQDIWSSLSPSPEFGRDCVQRSGYFLSPIAVKLDVQILVLWKIENRTCFLPAI